MGMGVILQYKVLGRFFVGVKVRNLDDSLLCCLLT